MVHHDALVAAFSDYADAVLAPYRIGDVLHRLIDQAVDVLGVDGAGVSLADGDDLVFIAATDASIATIEATQEAGRQGPCHDAYRTGKQVTVNDLAGDRRWPTFGFVAIQAGCRAVAGLPMPSSDRSIGALNLFRNRPHEWSDEELTVGQLLANMASGYVLNQAELSESRTLAAQLQTALDSRIILEQAKGIVAERQGVTPDRAFDLLRQQARSTQTRLVDVCQAVVDTSRDGSG